jgi:hypothetical protein
MLLCFAAIYDSVVVFLTRQHQELCAHPGIGKDVVTIRDMAEMCVAAFADLQMHWRTMEAMRLLRTITMMMLWTASCSIPHGGKRCAHAQPLSTAAFFYESNPELSGQADCFVHASAVTLQGLTICSCLSRLAMTSWTHIPGARTKAEGALLRKPGLRRRKKRRMKTTMRKIRLALVKA